MNAFFERIGKIHVITDTTVQRRFGHAELARLAIAGGADTIQLRDKHLSHSEFVDVALDVQAVCRAGGVTFIVNDRLSVAAEVGADGIHLGRLDEPIERARDLLGPDAIVGHTAGSVGQLKESIEQGADYVGFGHVFSTTSKTKSGPPVGIDTLREACAAAPIPVIAIGGITGANVKDAMDAGAWGVAVIGAVCGASDPARAARTIANIVTGERRE